MGHAAAPPHRWLCRAGGSHLEGQSVSMPSKRSAPFLQVVRPKAEPVPLRAEDFSPTTWQGTLFARKSPYLLVFIDFENTTEMDFLTVLVAANLRFMIDLRLVPRFDIGSLNRKLVFSLFQKSDT